MTVSLFSSHFSDFNYVFAFTADHELILVHFCQFDVFDLTLTYVFCSLCLFIQLVNRHLFDFSCRAYSVAQHRPFWHVCHLHDHRVLLSRRLPKDT